MAKSNKVKNRVTTGVLLLVAGAALLFVFFGKNRLEREEKAGIPDAVSTVSDGETCCLTVVANCDRIEDKEMFAGNVIRMYRENTFRSIRISTDLGEWVEKLDIRVYLYKSDIGNKEPVMRILYEPPDDGKEYNVKDNAEVYRMTICTGNNLCLSKK